LEKIDILNKNRNFGQKSKFWTIIEILDKNRNLGQKSFFNKSPNFGQKPKFLQKSKFAQSYCPKYWSKIKILLKGWKLKMKFQAKN